ncbi:hypothetical protein LEMLEM_LOCUS20304, partial [Lemmus lemmus]
PARVQGPTPAKEQLLRALLPLLHCHGVTFGTRTSLPGHVCESGREDTGKSVPDDVPQTPLESFKMNTGWFQGRNGEPAHMHGGQSQILFCFPSSAMWLQTHLSDMFPVCYGSDSCLCGDRHGWRREGKISPLWAAAFPRAHKEEAVSQPSTSIHLCFLTVGDVTPPHAPTL